MPKRYPRSGRRQIISLPDLLADSGEYVLVCLSKPVLEIARTFIGTRGRWNTTYSSAYGDSGYTPATAVEMDQVNELIAEFLESTNEMNCDEFIAEMKRIADGVERSAAANEQCCGPGSGGAGGSSEAASGFTDDGSTTFPTGYADRPAYETGKCQGAKEVIEQLKTDFAYIRDGSIVTLASTALVAALITPIPFDDIIALSTFAIALSIQGILVGTAQEIIDYLTNSEQDILCALYNADTVSDAIDDVDDGSMSTLASTLFAYAVNTDAFNRLFDYDQVGDYGANCAGCACDWVVDYGTGTPRTDNVQFVVNSEFSGGNYHAGIQLMPNCCGPDYRVHVDDVSFGAAGNGCIIQTCPGVTDVCGGAKLPIGSTDNVGGQVKQTYNTAHFSITLRIEEM